MYFIVVLLFGLSLAFGIMSVRGHHEEFRFLAFCFLLSAFGAAMASYFVHSAIALYDL